MGLTTYVLVSRVLYTVPLPAHEMALSFNLQYLEHPMEFWLEKKKMHTTSHVLDIITRHFFIWCLFSCEFQWICKPCRRSRHHVCFDHMRMRESPVVHTSLSQRLKERRSCYAPERTSFSLRLLTAGWTSFRPNILAILALNEKMPGSVVDIGWL